MIRIALFPLTVFLALGSTAGTGSAPPAQAPAPQQDYRWSGRLAAGQQIEVKGIVGDIRAEPSDGDEVVVTGHRSGYRAEEVRIEMVRRTEGVVICAVYPDDGDYDGGRGSMHRNRDQDDDEPRDACNPQHSSMHGEAPRVDFTVHVPAGVRLKATSVTGDVYARGLHSFVRAASVSGDVRVSSDGPVQAHSVSGDVEASMGSIGTQPLDFGSVSGNVTLRLPAGANADFSARTLSGEIDSDFPLTLGGGRRGDDDDRDGGVVRLRLHIGQQASGRLGRGGPEIKVNTVSGDITLRRR